MKNLLFFITALFCCLSAHKAQSPYYKMLGADNSWYISGYYYVLGFENSGRSAGSLGSAGQGEYRARFDSTVNGKTYKIFVHSPGSFATIAPTMAFCLVREDTLTKRVYAIPKDSLTERVVLDFSLNVGDSIFITYPNGNPILISGYYKVDSIRNRTIAAGNRKHLYLTNRNSPLNFVTGKRFFVEWIESVGAVHFPINIIDQDQGSSGWKPMPDWMLACGKQQQGSFVACKLTNGIKIYHDSCSYNFAIQNYGTSFQSKSNCDYYAYYFQNGIAELDAANRIKTYPSPASEELIIEDSSNESGFENLAIYDIVGQKFILPFQVNNGKCIVDLKNLKPGFYSFTSSTVSGKIVTQTFIKIEKN